VYTYHIIVSFKLIEPNTMLIYDLYIRVEQAAILEKSIGKNETKKYGSGLGE